MSCSFPCFRPCSTLPSLVQVTLDHHEVSVAGTRRPDQSIRRILESRIIFTRHGYLSPETESGPSLSTFSGHRTVIGVPTKRRSVSGRCHSTRQVGRGLNGQFTTRAGVASRNFKLPLGPSGVQNRSRTGNHSQKKVKGSPRTSDRLRDSVERVE